MPAAELQRSATYFRSMAKALNKPIQMAREDLVDARAAAREGDTTHTLTPTQALALKCGQALWIQLAEEIEAYLSNEGQPEPHPEQYVHLFNHELEEKQP